MVDNSDSELSALTADVVSAYVGNNKITAEELGKLIGSIYQALQRAGAPAPSEPEFTKPDKAVIRKSARPDYLISFIDGRKYKSLKRHLNTHGLDANKYRERYGLPNDYPMVASGYSAQRSELARSLGLGRRLGEANADQPSKAKGRGRAKASTQKVEPES